ncbi:MAG TPA: N,N-dimethylformamidase beta subunit family domain-containing protein [Isosphaeraceae bacterium]|nr:N,N-dimethylformamidase beta subunit family domain-containing protein [Isosphaeraceae bacterium]
MTNERDWTRRRILKTAAAGSLVSALHCTDSRAQNKSTADCDRIPRENELPGTRDWMTTKVAVDPKTRYRSPWIEGFASRTSVRPGESITLYVSTNPPSNFRVQIYRLGYYQGHGGRLVMELAPIKGSVQPDPPIGHNRLRECAWAPCAEITIPSDWTSGVYLGKLTAEREGMQSYVIFVVRDDRKCDFLFQVSDTTWNAYNRWPNQFSLYDDGKKEWYWGPNVATSFDRPYGKYCQVVDAPLSVGSGEFLLWEFPLAYWLEQQGYDVSYISNLDTHSDPASLLRAKGWLSVGHDEYWSLSMFETMKRMVSEGLNLAFLSGNSICGVIDIRASSDGRSGRVIERVGRFGSPRKEEIEKGFPEEALFIKNGPNEATLMGAQSTYPVTGGGDWTCRQPGHWLFAGTGMKEGDGIPGLVGWEWHGEPAPIPGLEVVASGKTQSPRAEGSYTATIYPGPKENLVFNAATIWWADGLSAPPGYVRPAVYTRPQGPDPRVQRITRNLLERMRRS